MDAAAAKQRQEPSGLRQPLLQRHYHNESQSYVFCGNEERLANGTSDFMPTPVAVTGLNNARNLLVLKIHAPHQAYSRFFYRAK
jgi:hypothetical protein